jgi:hypothetical protein
MTGIAITPREQTELLLEHARDTFSHQREYLRRRDLLFVYALVAAAAITFRTSAASGSDRVLALAVDRLLGADVEIDAGVLSALLWFSFFAVVARYFQAVVTVERQYEYLEKLETEITQAYGNSIFARESRQYLASYPRFSGWMSVVYSWVFPSAIVIISVGGVFIEASRLGKANPAYWIVAAVASSTALTAALFLYSTKVEKRDGSGAGESSQDATAPSFGP